ncbi:unnamed protein product (mitochondrion) [Plasmodiophora brassicae]|uniref:Uncharacterized protein n=1 Tax=Plasmodiophora brassicae TaxID=37360 RepID=A0A3P3YN03_PLABS|nr:unnamed protein product [Plasmodiophora brassicae]
MGQPLLAIQTFTLASVPCVVSGRCRRLQSPWYGVRTESAGAQLTAGAYRPASHSDTCPEPEHRLAMADGGRYSSVVLTCIALTLGVSFATPRRLYLYDGGYNICCKVKSKRATAHSGCLQNLVEDVPARLIRPFALERVAEKELRLFANYIATVDADDGRSTTRR